MIVRSWIVLAGMAAMLTACGPAQPPVPSNGSGKYDVQASAPGTAQCVATTAAENARGAAATNQARQAHGLAPVRPDARLARVAAQHACDMAKRGLMSHGGSTTSGPGQRVKKAGYAPRITAENIAAGPFSLPRVLAEWNGSSGHLENILIPQMRDYGIGRAVGSDGRMVFWSAVYAAPKGG